MAHTENLPNFHNAFASIYEGRFLAGVAAGMKLNEMIEAGKITAEQAKIGYVGAFTYAEVMSGYTSFYLGAKYMCPSVTMDVQFTGSWYDEIKEKDAATALINNGCVLISQHADSWGAPTACETAGVPNVSYNGSTQSACPNTFIISSRINWEPYFKYMIESVMNGTEIADDWCGGIAEGSVELSEINEKAAAAGTAEKLEEVKAGFADGSIKVFDSSTFTVNGTPVDSHIVEDTNEVISEGYFHESEMRSAPYFDIDIDGITKK
jgi:basic membrane protein A